MQYIYIDESGDLGFDFKKKGTSKYFVVAAVITKDQDKLKRIIQRVLKRLPPKNKIHHTGTFHAFQEKSATIRKILKSIKNESNIDIIFLCLNKKSKNLKYNELVLKLISNLSLEKVTLFLSQRDTNKHTNLKSIEDLKKILNKNSHVIITRPSDEKGLQVADTVSWSIFRKYESKDSSYYDLFKDQVIKKIEL